MRKVSIPTDDVDITSLVYPERISPSIRSRFLLFDAAAIVEWNSELVAIQTADARDRIALSADLGLAGALFRLRNAVTARPNPAWEFPSRPSFPASTHTPPPSTPTPPT